MKTHKLILFVAGDEPNSRLARETFHRIRTDHLGDEYDTDTVDVFEDFQAALDHNILLTPALLRVGPDPGITIYGNLSDFSGVLVRLGIAGRGKP